MLKARKSSVTATSGLLTKRKLLVGRKPENEYHARTVNLNSQMLDSKMKACYHFDRTVDDMKANHVCGKLIKQIHDELEKQANGALSSQNLTLAQMHVLMELNAVQEHQLTLKQLEGLLHVAQSTVAGIVSRLVQKGYVVCFADANDRRVKRVAITDDGMDCCRNAQGHIEEMEDRLLSGLNETEKELFCSLLQKICWK